MALKTKKIALFLFAFMIILLFGCAQRKIDQEAYSRFFSEHDQNTYFQEDPLAFYYCDERDGGVWRYEKESNKSMLLVANAFDFCLLNKYIYYIDPSANTYDAPEEAILVYRISSIGGIPEPVWRAEMFADSLAYGIGNAVICNLQPIGNLLCFYDSGISMIAYNPKTGETFRLLEDFSSFVALNNILFFVDHAARTFSLYSKPLYQPDAEPELIIGKGSVWERGVEYPNEIMIDSVYIDDGKIFFTQRNPDKLWEYQENGKHRQID